MILGFMTTWPERMGDLAGKPTKFPQKIAECLLRGPVEFCSDEKDRWHRFMDIADVANYTIGTELPKLHTIRDDKSDRWGPYKIIHALIHARTKNMRQFVPEFLCASTQTIEISYYDESGFGYQVPTVHIDGVWFGDLERLAINDGFPNLKAFLAYFPENYKGKIIHWTSLKY